MDKEERQEHLIHINNLCERFSVSVEKHLNSPDNAELLAIIKQLGDECAEYLKVSRS